jgi:hypothetical protein
MPLGGSPTRGTCEPRGEEPHHLLLHHDLQESWAWFWTETVMGKPARGADDRATHPPPGAGISGGHGRLMPHHVKIPLRRMTRSEAELISLLNVAPGALLNRTGQMLAWS